MSFLPSFSAPLYLFGLLGIGIIYYAYKTTKEREKKEVPSLYFLKQLDLPKSPSINKKLPLRFYLESLVILLLSLYLSNISFQKSEKRIAIILDNSMSMATTNSKGLSRSEEGIRLINSYIQSEASNIQYGFYTLPLINENKIEAEEKFLNKEEVITRLKQLKVFPFSDNAVELLSELSATLKERKYDEVLFVTDKLVKGEPFDFTTFKFRVVGTKENNIYISSARSRISPERNVIIDVSYGFSGSGSSGVNFTVKEISPNEKIHALKESVIQAGAEKIESIELDSSLANKNAILSVSVRSTPIRDSLSYDNEIFLIHSSGEIDTSILLASRDIRKDSEVRESLELALQKKITHLSCSSAESFIRKNPDKFKLHIFYSCKAPSQIFSNTLVMLPTESSNLIKVQKLTNSPSITSWNNTNPITRYLRLSNLSLPQAVILDRASWGSSIISSSEGSLLQSGNTAGSKLVVSGIELFPFEGKKNKISSILLLNVFSELLEDESDTALSTAYRRNDFSELQLLTKGILNITKDEIAPSQLENGIYKGILKETGLKKIFSVQNFFLEESDTFTKPEIVFEEKSLSSYSDSFNSKLEILLYIALLILVLDILLLLVLRREV